MFVCLCCSVLIWLEAVEEEKAEKNEEADVEVGAMPWEEDMVMII